jgi:putative glutamine amidotransferase
MKRPLILVTPDVETRPGKRGPTTEYVLGKDYARAVEKAGGLPLVAPYTEDHSALDAWIALAQGLLLTGGDFDVDPGLFGEAPHPSLGTLKKDRTLFELALLKRAEAQKIPVLGICGGMQLMNVVHGGTLIQDLATQMPAALEHQQEQSKAESGHALKVAPGGLLEKILGLGPQGANSTHHQAIRDLAPAFFREAEAPDGITEALSWPELPFFLGVQWHPESMADPAQARIYEAFIQACQAG